MGSERDRGFFRPYNNSSVRRRNRDYDEDYPTNRKDYRSRYEEDYSVPVYPSYNRYDAHPRREDFREESFGRPRNAGYFRGYENGYPDDRNFPTDTRSRRPAGGYYGRGRGNTSNFRGKKLCKTFTSTGGCPFESRCQFEHHLTIIGSSPNSHDSRITCLSGSYGGAIELYSGSLDGSLKRWAVRSDSQAASRKRKFPYELVEMSSTKFESGISCCLFVDDVLFVGFSSGFIKVLYKSTDSCTTLEAHKSEVRALTVIDGVLLSICTDGVLKLWKYEQSIQTFEVKHTMIVCPKVARVLEVVVPAPSTAARRCLWIGGANLQIIDLADLQTIRTVETEAPLVVGLILFQGHVIAAMSDGTLSVYTLQGDVTYTEKMPFLVSSIEGSVSSVGPVLVCGTTLGLIKIVKLPQFEDLGCINGHESCKVNVIQSLSPQSFLTAGDDGAIHMWTCQSYSDQRSAVEPPNKLLL